MKIIKKTDCCSAERDCSTKTSRREFLVAAGAVAVGSVNASVLADGPGQTYADAIKSHSSLRGYWQLDGNLVDATSNAAAQAVGKVRFVEGAVDGQALSLATDHPVAVPDTEHLRGESATLELFFKLIAKPSGSKDPVIIAQARGEEIGFIIGVGRDLSSLTYFEGRVPTSVHLPTAYPVQVGRWYHLAVTSHALDLRVYVDGHECALTGGALDFTRRWPRGKVPMTFGALDTKGSRQTPIVLDEISYFAEGLSIDQIQTHLKAGGWGERLKEVRQTAKRLDADRRKEREQQVRRFLSDQSLTERGESRVYRDERLEAISLTVGGIGAGAIQFNGKGEPAIWQIACNHTQRRVPHSFLAVRARPENGAPVVRALQTEPAGPFQAMESLSFQGEYPFGWYRFEDSALPVQVELEVFNPLIPLDVKNSSIPCAICTVKATNTSAKPVQVDVLASQQNAIGYVDVGAVQGQLSEAYGGNVNRVVGDGDATMLHMTRLSQEGQPEDMVLMTYARDATALASSGSLEHLHDLFETGGSLEGQDQAGPSPAGQTVDGAVSAPLTLAPGQSESLTFVLTWYFPNVVHGQARGPWRRAGNMYTNWWASAMDVAKYLGGKLDELTARTHLFHETLYASNLPRWLLDRLSSQLAVLRSQTCWWSADGYFGAWEGCAPENGCCAGNCTHVWHYAQAHARLLPELARKMREQDFDHQLPDGLTPFRHIHERTAADGHFGTVLNAYREYLCSVDDTWLKKVWPKIKKAMDWGIRTWDPNGDGFLQNIQHNTLDGEMAGCSSWIGTMYLSALQAAAKMAERMGEPNVAARYREIREPGVELQNERLWNGEYYIQTVGQERVEDYLDGCHIDQVLGEWWADQVNLQRNYPRGRVRQALEALLRHNFYANFHGQSLKPRQFVTAEDAGMKMITWPRGPQPIPGMKYGDEVMTGFEYGAGVSMVQNGMLREGLMVIKAIYDRYDGRRRSQGITNMTTGAWGYSGNPFGDDECGKFYGRSLSIWSALLALQGFVYDGPAGRIGFVPRWKPEDHASLFTVAEGYGLFTQKRVGREQTASIAIREGQLRLNEIELAITDSKQPTTVDVTLAGDSVDATFDIDNATLRLTFKHAVIVKSGQRLDMQVRT